MGGSVVLRRSSAVWSAWMCHFAWLYQMVKFRCRDQSETHGFFFQRRATAVRLFCDLGGIIVTDLRRKRRHQHQRALHKFPDALFIGSYSRNAMLRKRTRDVGKQLDGTHHAVCEYRFVDI